MIIIQRKYDVKVELTFDWLADVRLHSWSGWLLGMPTSSRRVVVRSNGKS